MGIIYMVMIMKTFYDVQQLLKKHGSIIYTKDREMDLLIMEDEVRELHEWGMIEISDYQQALLILRMERNKLKKLN